MKEEIDLIVFDECQDINDERLNLAKKIIYSLDDSCRILLLGDHMQAIYDFSAEEKEKNLLQWSKETEAYEFLNLELIHNHRSKNSNLSLLNQDLRNIYSENLGHISRAFNHFRRLVDTLPGTPSNSIHGRTILFRRNFDALEYYLSLIKRGTSEPLALRLGSFRKTFHPGLAFLAGFANSEGIASHDQIWSIRNIEDIEKYLKLNQFADLFDLVDKLCGHNNSLNISDLLGMALRNQLTSELKQDYIGDLSSGSVSSIHSFKGLEAEHVVIRVPDNNPFNSLEEYRIYYVGATRATSSLKIEYFSQKKLSYNKYSGRAYFPETFSYMFSNISDFIWSDNLKDYQESVFKPNQDWLLKNAFQFRQVDLLLNESKTGLKYDVVDSKTGRYIAMMSKHAFADIKYSIKKSCNLPARLHGLYMFGAVSQDADSVMIDLNRNDINPDVQQHLRRRYFILKPCIFGITRLEA